MASSAVEGGKSRTKPRRIRFVDGDDGELESVAMGSPERRGGKWFEDECCSLIDQNGDSVAPVQWDSRAEQLLQQRRSTFNAGGSENRTAWLGTVASSGTLSDRISALGVLVSRDPLANLQALDSLVQKVNKKNRREALIAAEVIKDLFIEELLPNRKLVPFRCRPFDKVPTIRGQLTAEGRKHLLCWKFEGELKSRYAGFVRALQALSHDTLTTVRIRTCRLLADLLIAKPEQEQAILSALIDKLGDLDASVASRVISLLTMVVRTHPNMRMVLVAETEKLIYRQNVSTKAQFYAICFLITLPVAAGDAELSRKLLNIYFDLFKIVLRSERVDEEQRMTRQMLVGINRVLPHAKMLALSEVKDEVGELYKMAATSSLSVSLLTLSVIYQVLSFSNEVDDRFYRALYRKILDPSLRESSRSQSLFFHLMYRAMCGDNHAARLKAFFKRLLQVCLVASGSFVCASLLILSKVQQRNRKVLSGSGGFWEHDEEEDDNGSGRKRSKGYDPLARDPQYANAGGEPLSELLLLKAHYHPTVALFAQKLQDAEPIDYSGDPLNDFSLMHFLERFVFKKPKVKAEAKSPVQRKRRAYDPWAVRCMEVMSEEYALMKAGRVPPDELFLHTWRRMELEEKNRSNAEEEAGPTAGLDFSRELHIGKKRGKRKQELSSSSSSDDEDALVSSGKTGLQRRFDASSHATDEFAELLEEAEEDVSLSGKRVLQRKAEKKKPKNWKRRK